MSETEPAVPDPGPLDADLRCPDCQYNLRGLAGDPLRCPECGRHSTRTELIERLPRLPTIEERVGAQMDAATRVFAVGVAGLLVWVAAELLGDRITRELARAMGAASAVITLIGLATVAVVCRGAQGWVLALLRSSLWVLPAMAVNAALALLAMLVAGLLCVGMQVGELSVVPVLGAPIAVIIYNPMRAMTRRGQRAFESIAAELKERSEAQ